MCRWSASTSHAWGVCPSAPCAHLNSKRHVATAFAAAHAREAPHRIRHACSNLFCPWIWQAGQQKTATQVTTSLQPRLPKRRGALDFFCPPALGTCVPCASWLVGPPLRLCWLLLCAANHRNARHRPESCPRPTGTHRKWATHPRPLPICHCLRQLGEANRNPGQER